MTQRNQIERIAKFIFDNIEEIQNDAVYRGQIEQSGEVVEYEFVKAVADIIEKGKYDRTR